MILEWKDTSAQTVFNLSNKVLTEGEIKALEKGLDFAPIQRKVNEPELRQDFENFCRRMRIKWHFRNEPSDNFSERPAFSPKSSWKPPLGHPNLEVFLSQVENELFEITKEPTRYSNLSQEQWRAIRILADDRSIVIKKADKGSCIVVWIELTIWEMQRNNFWIKRCTKKYSLRTKCCLI